MKKKEIKYTTLNDIRPNAGLSSAYNKQLRTILLQIKKEIANAKTKDLTHFGNRVDYLLTYWKNKLDLIAPDLARRIVLRNKKYFDQRFTNELVKLDFAVNLKLSEKVEQVVQASIAENVGLIKSIGTNYLEQVQRQVWAGVSRGYDLAYISKELTDIYGVNTRRANNIARDQVAKAHSNIERERRKEAGITQAIWLHSHAGKVPRESHLKANGKVFDIEKGMYLDGKWVQPAEEINCRCSSKAVIYIED